MTEPVGIRLDGRPVIHGIGVDPEGRPQGRISEPGRLARTGLWIADTAAGARFEDRR